MSSKTLAVAIAALKTLGASEEFLDALEKNDDAVAETLNADDEAKEIADNQKEIVLADDSNFKDRKDQLIASIFEARTAHLLKIGKQYGLTKEEVEALPKANRFDEAQKLLIEKIKNHKGDAGDAEKRIQELEEQISKKDEEITDLKENQLPAKDREWQDRINKDKLDDQIKTVFTQLSVDKDGKPRLVAKSDVLMPASLAKLNSLYDIRMGENGPELYEKGKNVLARKNSKPITLEQAFEQINTDLDIYRKSDIVDPNKTRKPVENGDDKARIVSGSPQDKFQKRLQEKREQKEQTA